MKTAVFIDGENLIGGIQPTAVPPPDIGACLHGTIEAIEQAYAAAADPDLAVCDVDHVAVYAPWHFRCMHSRPGDSTSYCRNCSQIKKRLKTFKGSIPDLVKSCRPTAIPTKLITYSVSDDRTGRPKSKSLLDTHLSTDMIAYEVAHSIDGGGPMHFVMFSGDADFAYPAGWLRSRGHTVSVVAPAGDLSHAYERDRFTTFEVVAKLPPAEYVVDLIVDECGDLDDDANAIGRTRAVFGRAMGDTAAVLAPHLGHAFWKEYAREFPDDADWSNLEEAKKVVFRKFGARNLTTLAKRVFENCAIRIEANDGKFFVVRSETEADRAAAIKAERDADTLPLRDEPDEVYEGYAERGVSYLGAGDDAEEEFTAPMHVVTVTTLHVDSPD